MKLYYLIASLPSLTFRTPVEITASELARFAQDQIKAQAYHHLESWIENSELDRFFNYPTLNHWLQWHAFFLQCLAEHREQNLHPSQDRFKPGAYSKDLTIPIQMAMQNPSPLEAEIILDQLRWQEMEQMERSLHFDFEQLLFYILKLKINQKHASLDHQEGLSLFKELGQSIFHKDFISGEAL